MTASGFKRDIETELRHVVDITLKQGVVPSRAAMTAIMRHEVNRIVEIRAKWGDPHIRVVRGNLMPSEEVAAFADNLIDQLLGPEE